MRVITLFLVLSLTASCVAQSSGALEWSVGYGTAYRRLSSGDENLGHVREVRNDIDKPARAISLNGMYFRPIRGRWEFGIGFSYDYLSYRIPSRDLRWGTQHDGMGGFDPSLPAGVSNLPQVRYSYGFLGIPVEIRHWLPGRLFRPFLALGVRPAYLLGTSDLSNREFYRSFNILTTARVGASYGISERITLQGGIALTATLRSIHGGTLRERPYSGTFRIGLRRELGSTPSRGHPRNSPAGR